MKTQPEKPHKNTGIRLKNIRTYTGMRQKEFADKFGVTEARYSNWETGFRRIPIECSEQICETYNLTLDYIYMGREGALPANFQSFLIGLNRT